MRVDVPGVAPSADEVFNTFSKARKYFNEMETQQINIGQFLLKAL